MRDRLTNNRNAFTYGANITVLTLALVIFTFVSDGRDQFRYLCLASIVLGTLSSLFYIFSINERQLTKEAKQLNDIYHKETMRRAAGGRESAILVVSAQSVGGGSKAPKATKWFNWLGESVFYIHGIIYMLTRVVVNVTMTMQPFYLTAVTEFEQTEDNPTPVQLAVVPLISYLVSLLFSLFI